MTTPVRTSIPRTQKQQNTNGERKMLHPTRNRMAQTTPQHNINSQSLFNPSLPQENAYYSTPQQVSQRVHRPTEYRSIDQNYFMPHNAYSSPQQAMAPREYQPPAQRRSNGSSYSSILDPTYNRYGTASQKQKEEDMVRKRREMQNQLRRDAEDYKKKQQQKEQKKREEYLQRHKFMYSESELFGGNKLGSSEYFNGNLQPDDDKVPVDPVVWRHQQEEARRKIQEEYDAKARIRAEKMKQAEEAKRVQQRELAAKLKAEEDKYKVGRQNSTPDVNIHREPVVKLSENGAIRKTQNQCEKIGMQNNSCNADGSTLPSPMKKTAQQMMEKDLEFQEQMNTHHYKYGRLPDVSTLKLRLDSTNNMVKKHFDKELVKSIANIVNEVEEIQFSDHVSSANEKKPVDKEKEFREEMRRARLKMQETMNLKVQELQAKSKQESDLA